MARAALARNVQYYRVLLGYSQAALARRVPTTISSISRLEHQQENPTLKRLIAVAKALDVPLWALLTPREGPVLQPHRLPLLEELLQVAHTTPDHVVRCVVLLLKAWHEANGSQAAPTPAPDGAPVGA